MANILSNLIMKNFYTDRQTAIDKVDACFAMQRITKEETSDLYMLINKYYPEVIK